MKKSILFLLLIVAISVGAQKYVPFPTDNAQWNVHFKNWSSTGGLSSYIDEYKQDGDTVINGKTYRKVYIKSPGTNNLSFYRGGIREENKRIYWLDNTNTRYFGMGKYLSNGQKDCMKQYLTTNTNEVVLYDFNKTNIGDTLITKIIAIDSVKIQNTYRKRYTILPYRQTIGWKYTYDYVIEGIGSVRNGLLAATIPLTTCMEPPMWEFVSFQQDNQVVYKNPAYVSYNSTTRWEEKKYFDKNDMWTNYIIYCSYLLPGRGYIYNKTQFYLGNDTLISEKTYHQIIERTPNYPDHPTSYTGGLREENGKVYIKMDNTNEFVLYDFTLNVGDTLKSSYSMGPLSQSPIISKIDTIELLNGENRKLFHTNGFEYIEGIGSFGGFFDPLYFICTCDPWYDTTLTCFKKENIQLYNDNYWCIDGKCCDLIMANPKIAEDIIKVNVNQTNDRIIVSVGELMQPCTFELLDLKGSVLLKTTVNASQNTVNLSPYDKGLYLYRISANGIMLKAGKIVKN